MKIDMGKAVLFLDEIQANPAAILSLRYFFEKVPQLAVIAAGSLLEFALEQYKLSMPVGRIEYLFMGPMTFEEFSDAMGEEQPLAYLQAYTLGTGIPQAVHMKRRWNSLAPTTYWEECRRLYTFTKKQDHC